MKTRWNASFAGPASTTPWLLCFHMIALPYFSRAEEIHWLPRDGALRPDWWNTDNWDGDGYDPETPPNASNNISIYIDHTAPLFKTALLTPPSDRELIPEYFRQSIWNNEYYMLYYVGRIRVASSGPSNTLFDAPLLDVSLNATYQANNRTYRLGLRSGRVQIGFPELPDKLAAASFTSGLWIADSFSVGNSGGIGSHNAFATFHHNQGTLVTDGCSIARNGIYRLKGKLITEGMTVSGLAKSTGGDLSVAGVFVVQYGGMADFEYTDSTIGHLWISSDGSYRQSNSTTMNVLSRDTEFSGMQEIFGGTFNSPQTKISTPDNKWCRIAEDGIANLGILSAGAKSHIIVEDNGKLNATSFHLAQIPTETPNSSVAQLKTSSAVTVTGDFISGHTSATPPAASPHGTTADITVQGASGTLTAANILLSQSPSGKTTASALDGGKITASNDIVAGAYAGGNANILVSGNGSSAKARRIWIGRDAGSTGTVSVSSAGTLEADSIVLGPITGSSNASLTVGGDNGTGGFLPAGSINARSVIRAGAANNTKVNFRHQSPAHPITPRLEYIDIIEHSGSGKTILNGHLQDIGTIVTTSGTLEIAHASVTNTTNYIGARDGGKIIINNAAVHTPADGIFARTILGAAGSGELSIINGGSLTSTQLTLGGPPPSGGTGTLNIEGAGSRFLLRDTSLILGQTGSAVVNLKSGARLTNITPASKIAVTLGEAATGSGMLTLSGFDTQFTTGPLAVGNAGRGTIHAHDIASLLQSDATTLGAQSSGEGNAVLGNNAYWRVNSDQMIVGDAGKGTVQLNTGATLRVGPQGGGTLMLGKQATGQGLLRIGSGQAPGNLLVSTVTRGLASPDRAQIWIEHQAPSYTLAPAFIEVDFQLVSGNLGTTTLTSPNNFLSRASITSGNLRVAAGGIIYMDGELIVGDGGTEDMDPYSLPVLEIDGPNSEIHADVGIHVGKSGDGEVRLKNGGKLVVRNYGHPAEHALLLGDDAANNFGTSTLIFGGSPTTAPGTLDAWGIHSYAREGRLIFDHSSPAFIMPAWTGGNLSLTHRSGTTLLTGSYHGSTSETTVTGGTLLTTAGLSSSVALSGTATYGGMGTTARVITQTGTTISPGTFRAGEEIATMRINSLNLFAGATIRVDMGPNLTCDKILNHQTGTTTTILHPLSSGTVTFDFRERGINQNGVYPLLTTTNPFSAAFMSRLAYTSNFTLQGTFRQTPITSGGITYHQLEFVVTNYSSPYVRWITPYGLDPHGNGAPDQDPDGDGLTNLMEYVLDSSPTSGVPKNMPTTTLKPTTLEFSFLARQAIVGTFDSTIEYSTDMKTWTTAPPSMVDVFNISGRGTVTTATIPRPTDGSPLFARLRVTR